MLLLLVSAYGNTQDEVNAVQKDIQNIELSLIGFSVEELVPVTGFLLSLSRSNQIKLIETKQASYAFADAFPVVSSSYALTTDVPITHLNNELNRFWSLQNIDVNIEFDDTSGQLQITRVGYPYTPSLISLSMVIFVSSAFLYLFINRIRVNQKLQTLSDNKRVDEWLTHFNASNKPWVLLSTYWQNQQNYWQQIKKESESLEKQAKIFFEAGDYRSAKLFISKALNINTSAPLANELVDKLKLMEMDSKDLNDSGQWISNRIAKSMSNYRNHNPYKALRQAYQALEKASQSKSLKIQLKAIRKLIKKILYEEAIHADRIQIKLQGAIDFISIGCESTLFVGRLENWTPQKDQGVIPFAHKGMSRLGKQSKFLQQSNQISIEDLNSTNGTYVNDLKLDDCVQYLKDDDVIYFAGNSDQHSVPLQFNFLAKTDGFSLSYPSHLKSESNFAAYANIWSDFVTATQRQFVVAQQNVVVTIKKGQELLVKRKNDKTKNCIELFEISFSPFLSLIPKKGIKLELHGQEVLGEMPIVPPIELRYEDKTMTITLDEFTYVRNNQHQERLKLQLDHAN